MQRTVEQLKQLSAAMRKWSRAEAEVTRLQRLLFSARKAGVDSIGIAHLSQEIAAAQKKACHLLAETDKLHETSPTNPPE